jgi:hypothetical protein
VAVNNRVYVANTVSVIRDRQEKAMLHCSRMHQARLLYDLTIYRTTPLSVDGPRLSDMVAPQACDPIDRHANRTILTTTMQVEWSLTSLAHCVTSIQGRPGAGSDEEISYLPSPVRQE